MLNKKIKKIQALEITTYQFSTFTANFCVSIEIFKAIYSKRHVFLGSFEKSIKNNNIIVITLMKTMFWFALLRNLLAQDCSKWNKSSAPTKSLTKYSEISYEKKFPSILSVMNALMMNSCSIRILHMQNMHSFDTNTRTSIAYNYTHAHTQTKSLTFSRTYTSIRIQKGHDYSNAETIT